MTNQPYVYRVQTLDGYFYYGARFAKDCHPDDFWVSYFTSSKTIKMLLQQHGKGFFKHKIVARCKSPEHALIVEANLISRTHKSPKSLNHYVCKRDGTAVYLGSHGTPSMVTRQRISLARKGMIVSEEGRRNISLAKTGIPLSESHLENIRLYHRSEHAAFIRAKIVKTSKTRTKTPEELQKISEALKGRKKPEGFGAQVSATNKARNATLRIWQTNRAQSVRHVWAKADQFYQLWKNEGWGHERFCNRMHNGLNVRVFYNMYKMFKYEDWIPSEDSDWVRDFQ